MAQAMKRCLGCDEPIFMCSCNVLDTSFVGEIATECYHRGTYVGGKQAPYFHVPWPFKPTIIFNHQAFILRSPYRHELPVNAQWGMV